MQANFKPAIKQQGFTLLLVLLALLVLGGVVITAIDITGSKQREAASQVPKASLDAAIQAGYRYTQASFAEESSSSKTQLCEAAYSNLNSAKGTQHLFLDHKSDGQKLYWAIDKIEKNCDGLDEILKVNIKAWQGAKAKPMSVSRAVATVGLYEEMIPGVGRDLADILGDRAVTTTGKLDLSGNTKVQGSTLADKLNLSGSSKIESVDSEGYSNTVEYNQIQTAGTSGVDTNMEKVDRTEKTGMEPLPDDPLGLLDELDKMYHIEESGNKIYKNEMIKQAPDPGAILKWLGSFATDVQATPDDIRRTRKYSGKDSWTDFFKVFKPVNFFDQDVNMGFTKSLYLAGEESLNVSGGDVYIFVDGSVAFQGSPSINIANDSSLTLIVTGDFTISGLPYFKFRQPTKRDQPFRVLTTGQNTKWSSVFGYESVRIQGSSNFTGLLYSLTDIKISGDSEIKGQVYAKNIKVTGSSRIIYQEADIPGGGAGNTGSSGDTTTYKLEFKKIKFL